MPESRLEEIVVETIRASGCELLKQPEDEPRAFDFGFQHKQNKRIAVEVKIRGSLTTYAVVVGANVRIARQAGYDELWLVTPEVPANFYTTKGIDEGDGKYARWLTIAQFATELGVPSPSADLSPKNEGDIAGHPEVSDSQLRQSSEQRPRRNRELQRLLLLQVRDGQEPAGLKDFSEAEQIYNAALLINDGLVEGEAIRGGDGRYVSTVMTDLTTAGHGFLDASEKSPERIRVVDSTEQIVEEIHFLNRQLSQTPLNPVEREHFEKRIAELRRALNLVGLDVKAEELSSGNTQNKNAKLKAWDAEFAKLRRDSGFRWSTTLDRVLDLLWLQHSAAFENSLANKSEERFEPQLTPRELFLAALLYGARNAADLTGQKDHRGKTLAMVALACGASESQLEKLLERDFFRNVFPQTNQDRAVVSHELERLIQKADNIRKTFGSDPYIGTRHLLLALLRAPQNGRTGDLVIRDGDNLSLNRMIAAFRESMAQHSWSDRYDVAADWPAEFEKLANPSAHQTQQPTSKPPPSTQETVSNDSIRVGGRTHFSRIAAGDEIALGVQGYANVLSKLLRASDDKDLCLAIFGPWGRGKTFLIEETIGKLTEQSADGKPRYEVVRFSAWKYPSRPEVWVHLFESFFCRLISVGWFRSLAFTILTGIQRHGVAKLWLAWAALMLTAMPKTWFLKGTVEYLAKFEFVIALAIVFFVTVFLWEFWTTTSHLRRHYLSGARHFEKLGLQGTIGNDLKALLRGWVQTQLRSGEIRLGLWLFWSAMIALVGVIFWRSHEAIVVPITLSVLALAIAGFVSCAFKLAAPSPSRILLVVDDLDRCQLDHLLAVMESIKLLLEDEEVSRRVQVVMLIEEDVLKHATWEKYKRLAESDAQKAVGTHYDGKRIVRESFEKLFTAHLRLGPLKPEDVADIVFNFGGKAERGGSSAASGTSQTAQSGSSQPTIFNSGVIASSAADDESDYEHGRQSHDPAPNEIAGGKRQAEEDRPLLQNHFDADFTMSSHEKQVMLAALHTIYGDKQSELGPRALRAIMFRYQLARLLLEELDEKTWNPATLAMMVVKRHLEGTIDATHTPEDSDILARVAEQVA